MNKSNHNYKLKYEAFREERERKNVYYVKSCRKDGTLDRNDIRTSDNNGVTFRDSSYSA